MTNTEAAITFNSGFMANVGLLATILGPTDVVVLDSYVHASIIDGCDRTKKVFFQHNDPDSLHRSLTKVKNIKNKVVVIDGVYSMDGDIANLPAIREISSAHSALLVVDESHALGTIGKQGRGTFDHFEGMEQADIVTGSLGKALGGIGGFVAGSSALINFLELYSRSFIFSTAIPPNSTAGMVAALRLLEEDDHLLDKLRSNVLFFKQNLQKLGFRIGPSETAIQPLFITDMDLLMKFCLLLHRQGVLINPIVFPVVPKKKSRIRLSLTAGLSQDQMELALECFSRYGRELKMI
jgi:glycine C-acetyltransferase